MRKSIEFYCEAYDRFQNMKRTTGIREMAKILGVDPTTISRWERGHSPYTQFPKEYKTDLGEAKYMLEEGYTYAAVGRYLGVRPENLRKHFPGMGHPGKKMVVGEDEFSLDAYV